MGGKGSGRYGYWGEKPKKVVERTHQLSISQLKQLLPPGHQQISIKSGSQDKGYFLSLAWTDCNYGNQRPWFVCPQCQRRAGKLYQVSRQGQLACRICHNLTYRSCQTSKGISMLELRSRKLKRKLGAKDASLSKPKGMHNRTYEHICYEMGIIEAELQSLSYRRTIKLYQSLSKLGVKDLI